MSEEQSITEYIEAYILHDPVANVEGVLADFDPQKLQQAEESGAIFIALYNTGKREVVKAEDITEPEPRANGVKLVAPSYVDKRMKAVVDVFDALGSSMPQALSAVSVMSAEAEGTGMTFAEALAALKALVYGEEG